MVGNAFERGGKPLERLTIENARKALKRREALFEKVFQHGSLEVEYYKPEIQDYQSPHTRDEIYVIASGSGIFVNGESREPYEVGEVLFVPAGVEHRFEEFTEDFATWVFFYGPEGGESSGASGAGPKFRAVNPVLPVKNVSQAIDFYVHRLGFHLLSQDSAEHPHYACVARGGAEIHLQWHDESEWDRAERPQLRFVVEDVDALFNEWIGQDVYHESTQVRNTAWHTREFAFFDPNNNGLTFYQGSDH